ncbi:MAG TPA: DUF6325 family protein [Gaiellaceae bacterium]|nr:DUF6325 family protein [Gaiellaceae bacterium]
MREKEDTMGQIGPVQLIAIGFGPEAKLDGRILDELAKLEEQRTVRLLDLLFLLRDSDSGDLVMLEHQGEDLGAIIGALLGFEFDGVDTTERDARAAAEEQHAFGLARDQIDQLAGAIQPGQAAAFLLIEHVWARDLKAAVREAGGLPLGEGFLTPEVVAEIALEAAAMAAALDEVEAEHAAAAIA